MLSLKDLTLEEARHMLYLINCMCIMESASSSVTSGHTLNKIREILDGKYLKGEENEKRE